MADDAAGTHALLGRVNRYDCLYHGTCMACYKHMALLYFTTYIMLSGRCSIERKLW